MDKLCTYGYSRYSFFFISIIRLISTIKAYKTNNKNQILISGSWIGLAVMMKTYLTIIPLLGLFPFLIRSKLIYKRNFWVGTILGFLPFLLFGVTNTFQFIVFQLIVVFLKS